MGRVKEVMMDCLDAGVVPADPQSVASWAERLGEHRHILDGMPMQHRVDCRGDEIDVDVIPVEVAEIIDDMLPDTFDELGWMIQCYEESLG